MTTETDATTTLDLAPAAAELGRVVRLVQEAALDEPTPCEGMSVRDLLQHLLGATEAFRRAPARGAVPYEPDDVPLDEGGAWRAVLQERLDGLVEAWRPPQAWEGETHIAGMTMPASETGAAAVDELVLHAWDLARATDQPFHVDDASLAAVLAFTRGVADAGPAAREGLFGPPVPVPDSASDLDRALGLAGWDPAWAPSPLPAEEALRRVVGERVAAVAAQDTVALAARQAPGVTTFDVLPPLRSRGSGAVQEKTRAWFDSYRGAPGYEVAELEVHAHGDVGFCSFLYRVTGTLTAGGEVDMWVRATLGCRLVDGRWLVVHDHESVPFDPSTGEALLSLRPEPSGEGEVG